MQKIIPFTIACIILILWTGNYGCDNAYPKEQNRSKLPSLVRSFKNSGNWDSVYLYNDGHLLITEQPIKMRYFLLSYSIRLVSNDGGVEGHIYLTSDLFPLKKEVDAIIFKSLEFKRKCYQNIILTSIIEFKSEEDFERCSSGAESHKMIRQKLCE